MLAFAIPLLWVAWGTWLGRKDMYSPGPLALSHQQFDCAACHVQSWQTLQRLFTGDQAQVRSAMDQACVQCHQGLVHHDNEIRDLVPNCVSCHKEHKGAHGLSVVADKSCILCHGNLQTSNGPSTCFAGSVTALASHPEFAVLRKRAADPGTIRFNHAVHLAPAGLHGTDGKAVFLKCGTCHQPAPPGDFMQPIRFQEHCLQCHDNTLVFDAERLRDRPVPHGSQPELLRGLFHESYRQYVRAHPEELSKKPERTRPLPGRSTFVVTKEEWNWVADKADKADRILFYHGGGCRYCHEVKEQPGREVVIAPANIPGRWLLHGKFSHFAHRFIPAPMAEEENCAACHGDVHASSRTSDVLLPSLRKCQECHDERAGLAKHKTTCISCHAYHNQVAGKR